MATPSEKLASSLEALKELQDHGLVAIQARDLTRTHRERLLRTGFLQEVIKGWYIPSRPDESAGDSTAWYTSFWKFISAYLNKRYGNDWCLSPEQSLSLHAGNWTVPSQLLVRSSKGDNKAIQLPHNTSLFNTRSSMPNPKDIAELNGVRIFSLPASLVSCSPKYFTQNPTDIRAALSTFRDASEILRLLLEGGHSVISGRIAGAFRDIGRDKIADNIIKTMQSVGYDVREKNPYLEAPKLIFSSRERSPYVNRMQLLWQQMREDILNNFPAPPGLPINKKDYIHKVDETYVTDAYHSLSIEGYRVSPELINKVRSGKWNPDKNDDDHKDRNALAARGYWQAFKVVKKSIQKILKSKDAAQVADDDHRDWYFEMFSPGITAGIIKPEDLSGYRNDQVYIRHSMHVPPNKEAVRDLMPAFFELLMAEKEPSVRVVLGHFFFVNIHPYMDGNGRMGRFLMNVMLAGGGYPWVVVPVEQRKPYMTALEEASVSQNIKPFTKFITSLIKKNVNW